MSCGSASVCVVSALFALRLLDFSSAASAETIAQALAATYADNPTINSARANTRAVDENVAIARGGGRPTVSAIGTGSGSSLETAFSRFESVTYRSALGLQVEQPLFRGFRVRNAIREAKSSVLARRELLRNTAQNVLFDAAQAYMDVVLTTEITSLRRRNVEFLFEQVRGIQSRFAVGDLTRTDVAQGQSRLAAARANLSRAEAALERIRADYHRIVGHHPVGLVLVFPYRSLIPSALDEALFVGLDSHPFILASALEVDAQAFVVKQIEGGLLPSLSIVGTAQHNESYDTGVEFRSWSNAVAVEGRVSIPLYQGGVVGARTRQAKEILGQLQIDVDSARDQVRDAVVSAWADVRAVENTIAAARDGVRAAEQALSGVQSELRVGQRTTLDVLDAQQELLSTRESLVAAERDQTVALFSLLSAIGKLNAEDLRLPTAVYDPAEHYRAVQGKWHGTTTPDGR